MMENNKGLVKKKKTRSLPLEVKRQAISDFNTGRKTAEEIATEFDISVTTIPKWKIQIKYETDGFKNRFRPSVDQRIVIAREVSTGLLTVKEAMVKYGVRKRETIIRWADQYSSQIGVIELPKTMKQEEEKEFSALHERNKLLEKALENAHLQIAGLKTMINIAEKELHIDLRKKYGSKQS